MSVDHRAMAEHRLEKSRRILERQRKLIAARRAARQPTAQSEKVLATFERSHTAKTRSGPNSATVSYTDAALGTSGAMGASMATPCVSCRKPAISPGLPSR